MSEKTNNSYPKNYKIAENKLLLLYLIDRIDIPLSNSQISQFALEEEYMNYFSVQECLSEMVNTNLLESIQEDNNTRYSMTDEGIKILKYFEQHLSTSLRNEINTYVLENRRKLKRDFEIIANYFYDGKTNEYIVKCGVYEDSKALMEINVSVVTREHAKIIVSNWKNSASKRYNYILENLVKEEILEEEKKTDKSI